MTSVWPSMMKIPECDRPLKFEVSGTKSITKYVVKNRTACLKGYSRKLQARPKLKFQRAGTGLTGD